MYARTTMVTADPRRMHEGVADIRDKVMPAVAEMAGYTGLSMLADRSTGRCIVTTSWESEEAMRASRDEVRRCASRPPTGRRPRHRGAGVGDRRHAPAAPATDDSCARVMWTRGGPAEGRGEPGRLPHRIIPRWTTSPASAA